MCNRSWMCGMSGENVECNACFIASRQDDDDPFKQLVFVVSTKNNEKSKVIAVVDHINNTLPAWARRKENVHQAEV